MSVTVDIYPEILIAGEPLRLTVRNPTNSTVDIQINFYKDSTLVLSVVLEDIEAGQTKDVILPDSETGLSEYAGETFSVVAGLVSGGSGGAGFWSV